MEKLFIQSYGCAMNFSDSEIVASILKKEGYSLTNNYDESDLILLNTCSIREKAEETIRKRLKNFNNLKKNDWIRLQFLSNDKKNFNFLTKRLKLTREVPFEEVWRRKNEYSFCAQ